MAGTNPIPIRIDSVSRGSIDPLATFYGFQDPITSAPDDGTTLLDYLKWQREWPRDSTIMVTRGYDDLANGVALLTAYAEACDLTPGGNALSANNRATVLVPSGVYQLLPAVQLLLDTPYVDLVAFSAPVTEKSVPGIIYPSAIIYSAAPDLTGVVQVSADDIRLVGIAIITLGAAPALRVTDGYTMEDSLVRGCRFVNDKSVACVDHVLGDTKPEIGGVWEDCVGENGLFSECTFKGIARRCRAGDYSFGYGLATGSFTGEAYECVSGTYSFGCCTSANAECSGTISRCTAGYCSFGYCLDTLSTFAGTCSATMDHCYAGANSYGAALDTAAAGVFAGTATFCEARGDSFGNTLPGGALGIFSGVANNCVSSGDSFGSSQNVGTMRDCINLGRSLPLPAATTSKYHDCTILASDPKATYSVTGEIDGGAPPAVVVGAAYICTTGGGGFTLGTLYLGTAGLPDTWEPIVVSVDETMRPDHTYGTWVQNRVYYQTGGGAWACDYRGSAVLVIGGATPSIHYCKLIAEDDLSPTVVSVGPEVVQAGHCMMNTDMDGSIINQFGVHYNIVNVYVTI